MNFKELSHLTKMQRRYSLDNVRYFKNKEGSYVVEYDSMVKMLNHL